MKLPSTSKNNWQLEVKIALKARLLTHTWKKKDIRRNLQLHRAKTCLLGFQAYYYQQEDFFLQLGSRETLAELSILFFKVEKSCFCKWTMETLSQLMMCYWFSWLAFRSSHSTIRALEPLSKHATNYWDRRTNDMYKNTVHIQKQGTHKSIEQKKKRKTIRKGNDMTNVRRKVRRSVDFYSPVFRARPERSTGVTVSSLRESTRSRRRSAS